MIGDQHQNFLNFYHNGDQPGNPYSHEPDERKLTAMREKMVEEQIENRGISNDDVLEAMRNVPRHKFVPELPPATAYEDRPLPIGENQTISQPYIVALMTAALDPDADDRVLEVGTGSGYQAAVLAEIVQEVYTIERHERLMQKAREVLNDLGYNNISYRIGDGTKGWEAKHPFDGILVTAGGPEVPQSLVQQLEHDGGQLVIPVGTGLSQELIRITQMGGETRRENLGACSFVKLVGEEGW